MLAVENIAVDHGKLRAVWDFSFQVRRGERVGLLGANGAGKSTTMGALAGLYPLASGKIRLDEEVLANGDTAEMMRRGIALVPEGRRLFPEMTVEENLLMGAFMERRKPEQAAALRDVYELFPILEEKRAQAAGELSGGQQQMVAIGRALMSRPRLLLLDEPFIGVAPLMVETIAQTLRRISERGVTIVLVEQNVHRALELVERAYVLENGRCVLEGTRDEILKDADFTHKLLGLD